MATTAQRTLNVLKHKARNQASIQMLMSLLRPQKPPSIEFVCATRLSPSEFNEGSMLGRSIAPLLLTKTASLHVAYQNSQPLASVYNPRIDASTADILIFIHDDVFIRDTLLTQKVSLALSKYDAVGVAGNKRRLQNQPAWAFKYENNQLTWDHPYLSGEIKHGNEEKWSHDTFGPTPAKCKILDGVFLAATTKVLRQNKIYFNPEMAFHFYDLDFCRSLESAGLAATTWPIDIIHGSGGAFNSEPWQAAKVKFFNKWKS